MEIVSTDLSSCGDFNHTINVNAILCTRMYTICTKSVNVKLFVRNIINIVKNIFIYFSSTIILRMLSLVYLKINDLQYD